MKYPISGFNVNTVLGLSGWNSAVLGICAVEPGIESQNIWLTGMEPIDSITAEDVKSTVDRESYKPVRKDRGWTLEQVGNVLNIYQKNRRVYL